MVIYIYHFLLFKRSLPRVDVEQTSLKGKVEEMIKITKRFLKECSVLDGGGCARASHLPSPAVDLERM